MRREHHQHRIKIIMFLYDPRKYIPINFNVRGNIFTLTKMVAVGKYVTYTYLWKTHLTLNGYICGDTTEFTVTIGVYVSLYDAGGKLIASESYFRRTISLCSV